MTLIAVRTVRRGDAPTLASLTAPTMIPAMAPLNREITVEAAIPPRIQATYSIPVAMPAPTPRAARSHIALEGAS